MLKKTPFKNLIIVKNNSHKDKRGYFKELLKEKNLRKKFPFTVMSFSRKNVLRGLHLQTKKMQGKFVTVIKGKILDVAVDLRKNSRTFGKHFKIILSEKNNKSIYIPPGFAHGFYAMGTENYIIYSCTNYRNKNSEIGIKYNDKLLRIKWPKNNPIISLKDRKNLTLKEYLKLKK